MQYSDFPMPKTYPDFPHHTQIKEYFDDYVDHFGLRELITFETAVEHAALAEDGVWEVAARHRRDAHLRLRCSSPTATIGTRAGRNRPSPDRDTFSGVQMHAHSYEDNSIFAGKQRRRPRDRQLRHGHRRRVLLRRRATPISPRAAGAWIIPKYLFGRPARPAAATTRASRSRSASASSTSCCQSYIGAPERYGLPKPDHRFGEAHPTVSGRILDRIQHGTVTPKPNIERLEGSRVHFVDGTSVEADVVVYCTGYKITFPFFDQDLIVRAREPHRALPPGLPSGDPEPVLHRPAAAARRDHAAGRGAGRLGRRLHSRRLRAAGPRRRCRPTSTPTSAAMRKRYVASKRHTIQVDFDDYLYALAKERRAGAERARARGLTASTSSCMPTFCRHNRFIERCPICSKTMPEDSPLRPRAARSARSSAKRPSAARPAQPAPAHARTPRGEALRVRREIRARGRRIPLAARPRAARLRRRRSGWPRRSPSPTGG